MKRFGGRRGDHDVAQFFCDCDTVGTAKTGPDARPLRTGQPLKRRFEEARIIDDKYICRRKLPRGDMNESHAGRVFYFARPPFFTWCYCLFIVKFSGKHNARTCSFMMGVIYLRGKELWGSSDFKAISLLVRSSCYIRTRASSYQHTLCVTELSEQSAVFCHKRMVRLVGRLSRSALRRIDCTSASSPTLINPTKPP